MYVKEAFVTPLTASGVSQPSLFIATPLFTMNTLCRACGNFFGKSCLRDFANNVKRNVVALCRQARGPWQ